MTEVANYPGLGTGSLSLRMARHRPHLSPVRTGAHSRFTLQLTIQELLFPWPGLDQLQLVLADAGPHSCCFVKLVALLRLAVVSPAASTSENGEGVLHGCKPSYQSLQPFQMRFSTG